MKKIAGVIAICPTPFTPQGEVDLDSLARLVDFQLEAGIHGLAILGFLGELHKLTSFERRRVVETVVARTRGAVPVWVGVRAFGTAGAIEQSRSAESLGADGVFVAPLAGACDAALFDYYQQIAESVAIPVAIHDFPDSFGTTIAPELIARLAQQTAVRVVKLEEPPVGPKISRIRELAGDAVSIFGGLGGVYFLEELQRGAIGTMTGFAFPEVLLRIYALHAAQQQAQAAAVFDRYCPLLRYEFQPGIGLALRKHVYMQRKIIASDFIRAPGAAIDDLTRRELAAVVQRVGLALDRPGVQSVA